MNLILELYVYINKVLGPLDVLISFILPSSPRKAVDIHQFHDFSSC